MSVVITREDIIAYAEVDYIIHHMNEKYIEKVPQKLIQFFSEIKDPEHKIYVDPYKPLQSQGLRKYTLEIIALLHLKYWCEDEERKKQLYDLMLKNEEKLEEQLKEKYSIDKLFDNSVKVVTEAADLEKEDFSKPKKVQYVATAVPEEKKPEEEAAEQLPENIEESKNIFSKIKEMISQILHRFQNKKL